MYVILYIYIYSYVFDCIGIYWFTGDGCSIRTQRIHQILCSVWNLVTIYGLTGQELIFLLGHGIRIDPPCVPAWPSTFLVSRHQVLGCVLGWPKMDSVKLVLDLNTTEHGYAIRSIRADLSESCPDFSLMKFVQLGCWQWNIPWIDVHGFITYIAAAYKAFLW